MSERSHSHMRDRYLADDRSLGVNGLSAPSEGNLAKANDQMSEILQASTVALSGNLSKSRCQTHLSQLYMSSPTYLITFASSAMGGRWPHLPKMSHLNLVSGEVFIPSAVVGKDTNHTKDSSSGHETRFLMKREKNSRCWLAHRDKRGWTRVLSGRAHDLPKFVPLGTIFRLVSKNQCYYPSTKSAAFQSHH